MIQRPPRSTSTETLVPYTTRYRSLASQLTGWDIVILTEEEESERRQEEFRSRSQMFIDALEVDDVLAHLLVTEGFSSVEEVAFVRSEEHTSELQSLMRISYAVFCLKNKTFYFYHLSLLSTLS